jgi:hypothetical protein
MPSCFSDIQVLPILSLRYFRIPVSASFYFGSVVYPGIDAFMFLHTYHSVVLSDRASTTGSTANNILHRVDS